MAKNPSNGTARVMNEFSVSSGKGGIMLRRFKLVFSVADRRLPPPLSHSVPGKASPRPHR